MTTKATFSDLHRPGEPLLLYNAWDIGSAKAIAAAGAKAIATGSLSLAGAQGYDDGEQMPLDILLNIAARIVAAVDVPVSIDFEGGYATDPDQLASHAQMLADTGAVGCNFEDRRIHADGLYDIREQVQRIEAMASSGLFVNARTDLFLEEMMAGENANEATLVDAALERSAAYAEAGASSFFAPALSDLTLIARLCEGSELPINVMMLDGGPSVEELASCGVARISWGPGPWRAAMARVTDEARAIL